MPETLSAASKNTDVRVRKHERSRLEKRTFVCRENERSRRKKRTFVFEKTNVRFWEANRPEAMYVCPVVQIRSVSLEGWIACTANNLAVGGITGKVSWTDEGAETTLGASDDGHGNVYVLW
jgi:hypothetical protein